MAQKPKLAFAQQREDPRIDTVVTRLVFKRNKFLQTQPGTGMRLHLLLFFYCLLYVQRTQQ